MINTSSSQYFAGLDKFRLRTSLGKIKEMSVKMNKTKKSNRNESCMNDFLSSTFSPVMANLAASSSAVFFRKEGLKEKISFLQHLLKKFLVCRRLDLYWTSAESTKIKVDYRMTKNWKFLERTWKLLKTDKRKSISYFKTVSKKTTKIKKTIPGT